MNSIGKVLAGLFAVFLFAFAAQAAPTFPPLTGRVVDDAHVLSQQTQDQLTSELASLEAKTSRQLVVVTLPGLQGYPIEDYGYQLLRTWGIGQKKLDNGALFIIVPSARQVRIEVGYGLEPILTDALSSVILNSVVVPKFRAGDVQGGIVAGTDEIVQQLSSDPSAAEARVAQAEQRAQARGSSATPIRALIPFLFIILILVSSIFRGGRGGGLGWFLPMMILGGMGRGWGGGGGGGFGGGGFGGGFSGGGGSGGGGGASAGW